MSPTLGRGDVMRTKLLLLQDYDHAYTHTYTQTHTHARAKAHIIDSDHSSTMRRTLAMRSGGDLAPSLGGRKIFSRTKISEWGFIGKNFHYHGQNFSDVFFSHLPGFSDFPFCFPDFSRIFYYVKCRISPFPHKNNHYFRKEFLYDTFFYSVRSVARIRQY